MKLYQIQLFFKSFSAVLVMLITLACSSSGTLKLVEKQNLSKNVIEKIEPENSSSTLYPYPAINWYYQFVNFTTYELNIEYEILNNEPINDPFTYDSYLGDGREINKACYGKIESLGYRLKNISSSENVLLKNNVNQLIRRKTLNVTLAQIISPDDITAPPVDVRKMLTDKEKINDFLKLCYNSLDSRNITEILESSKFKKMNYCPDAYDTDEECYRIDSKFKELINEILLETKKIMPHKYASKFKDTKLKIAKAELSEDLLWIEYVPEESTIYLSPFFLRAAFVSVCTKYPDDIISLTDELKSYGDFTEKEISDEIKQGSLYNDLVRIGDEYEDYQKVEFAKKVIPEFKKALMFYIAHELSHTFVEERKPPILEEYICDCIAYTETVKAGYYTSNNPINRLISISLESNKKDYWGMSPKEKKELRKRIKNMYKYHQFNSSEACFFNELRN